MSNLIATWSALAAAPSATPILPDGCRDLICLERPGTRPKWFISPLQTGPSPSIMHAGDRLTGFRLTPGARINQSALLQAVHGHAPDPDSIHQNLADFTTHTPHIGEALSCLGETPNIAQAAADLGVRIRSLQRLTQRQTGKSPGFWYGLARVRKAARLIHDQTPLAEAAFIAGYADQAHMSRAFRRWFGVTPRGFLADPRLTAQAGSLAFG